MTGVSRELRPAANAAALGILATTIALLRNRRLWTSTVD